MPVDLDWTGDLIPGELEESFHQANEVLGRAFQFEITARKWSWPISPTPRDIVDLGNLRASYAGERAREGSNPAYDHTWNTEYALAVHQGYVTRGGSRMPGRPWTKKPVEDGTLPRAMEALVRGRFE